MKTILFSIILIALIVCGYSQTRNVLVGTNNAVVQPTNFWSVDASNARAGLGLGSAATNPATVFQSSSSVLSNLASSNAINLTNIRSTNIVGVIPSSNIPTVSLTNIGGTLAVTQGGTGATNAGGARTNLGLGATNNVSFLSVTASEVKELGLGFRVIDLENMALTFSTNYILEWSTNSVQVNRPLVFFGTNVANESRTNLGLGGANSVVFSNLSLSNGAQTNLAIAIGSTNRGFFVGTAPERIGVVVGGSNVASFFSGAFEVYSQFSVGANVAVNSNLNIGGSISFVGASSNIAITRTNLGLGWSALTNSNAGTGLVSVDTNGDVVSPTNFWQRAPIQTAVQDFTGITVSQTNNATNARNVYVYSLATNVSGISNTIILPTNVSTFNGDEVTVVHKGTTNTTTVVRQAGSTNNLITLNKFDESVKFIRELGQWDFYHNISFVEPIQFSGTNAVANVAASRTNLGLGITNEVQFGRVFVNGVFNTLSNAVEIYQPLWIGDRDSTNAVFEFETTSDASIARTNLGLGLSALTNTSNTTFQQAIFTTNAAPTNPTTPNFGDYAAWMGVSIVTNGVTNVFKIPLYK